MLYSLSKPSVSWPWYTTLGILGPRIPPQYSLRQPGEWKIFESHFTWVCLPPWMIDAGPPESPWQASTPEMCNNKGSNYWKRREENLMRGHRYVWDLLCRTLEPFSGTQHLRWFWSENWKIWLCHFCHLCLAENFLFFAHAIHRSSDSSDRLYLLSHLPTTSNDKLNPHEHQPQHITE